MINSRNIKDLHPTLQKGARELSIRLKKKGYEMVITATYRDNEYQNYLYQQGRTRAGQIVTNAKGGQSLHNYHLAFDIAKNIVGQEYSDLEFFAIAGQIWDEMGGKWGGNDTSFYDRPHFQFTNNLSLQQLMEGEVMGDVKMNWENYKEEIEDKEITIMFNSEKFNLEGIYKNGNNYLKLRELEKLGMKISYDEKMDMPVINF